MGIRLCWPFFVVHVVLVFFFSFQALNFLRVGAYSNVIGNKTDRLALLDFKSKISYDPLGVLGSWNESIHFCHWHGVTCSPKHQRVTILNLEYLKLTGSISPSIGNLSFLEELNLQNNNFTHQIPSEIGRLRRLEFLALNSNSIGGEIPENISGCSNLIRIKLDVNKIAGRIPSQFGSLSKLEVISLAVNKFTGSIPSSLGNISSIRVIYLSRNELVGNIPDTFSQLKSLVIMELAVNQLSGMIPSLVFNISSITVFDVGFNQIEGDIPMDIGLTLPNLRIFSIASNKIANAIPPSISNATKLEQFQVPGNRLTGKVPYLEKLQRLFWFIITSNNLGSGRQDRNDLNFICSLTNATNYLEELDINDNNFGGLLPGCIGSLSATLTVLLLDNNKIVGSIPTGIGKFSNLQRLEMWSNQLSGTIPLAIGKLRNLQVLFLDNNNLSGKIPFSIGNLKLLIQLYLNDNFLWGNIPSSLGQCKSLMEIDLSNNNLSGTIPPQIIGLPSLSISLQLSGNRFTGALPIEVGNLKNLGILDVSRNLLSGEIPISLGRCIRLEQLYMQGNIFQGPILSSFSSLKGLEVLDLSQNNLSGEIPNFLARFKFLRNLNLSYNDFRGMIPTEGIFNNGSATSVLGNSKLCGGIPEFHMPKCGSTKSKQRRLALAQKLVIVIVSGLVGLTLVVSFLFLCLVSKKEKHAPRSWTNSLINLTYQNLYNSTDGFSLANLIGAGSFGYVYKGILNEGKTTIAVKVFNPLHHGAFKSFIAECEAIRNIRHRNLIKILTACSGLDDQGNEFKALVYEFMPNGSLEEWLYPITGKDEIGEAPKNLNLLQRLGIAIDVACALKYLHHDCQPATAHCDLKPKNILLDDEMIAHVGDFGLARILPPTHNHTSSIGVKGSIGYIAPEYGLGSEVSTNGDVYSYGILLLEMITGKKPTNFMFEGDLNLHSYARVAFPDHVMDIVDPMILLDDEDLVGNDNQQQKQARINSKIECLISMIRIGVHCSMESPQDRKNINSVVQELKSIEKFLESENMFDKEDSKVKSSI